MLVFFCSYFPAILFIALKGNVNIAPIKENTPSTAIPINLNGKRRIHMIGYKISAAMAMGQHNINRMSHTKNANIVFWFEFRPTT
jgi:hypothetical protein